MENIPESGGSGTGLGPTKIESTIHGPSSSEKGKFSLTEIFSFPGGQRIDDSAPACHVYGAIWSPFMVQFYVDDWRKPFFVRTAADVPDGGRWVFNAPFYLLLNLAVGGDWPGPPNNATPSAAEMVVHYVRVYKASRVDAPKLTSRPLKTDGGPNSITTLELRSAGETGFVFLACETKIPGSRCSVNTGNPLNTSVVDFHAGPSQGAKIIVTARNFSYQGDVVAAKTALTVTAYTVSGEQSSISIPIE
jgi:beta-glucanase (GH16 family)